MGESIESNQKMFVSSPASASTRRPPSTVVRFGIAIAAAATMLGAAPEPVGTKFASEIAGSAHSDASSLVSRSAPAPEPNLVTSVSADRARLFNDALPFSKSPIEPATPLLLSLADAAAEGRSSLDCLTEAVYYEAASEPDEGQRAVAQVVLNRVRHPSFPNSVCGVVYQGSERRTGCQFTFTCDGSLRRTPSKGLWLLARQIAESALRGGVEASVGMATHYHTDWVFPYWAPNLKKITQVGTHIFYGWSGSWGRRAAFTEMAVADSLLEAEAIAVTMETQPEPSTLGSEPPSAARVRLVADLTGTAPVTGSGVTRRHSSGLLADDRAGALHVDNGSSRVALVGDQPARSLGTNADPVVQR